MPPFTAALVNTGDVVVRDCAEENDAALLSVAVSVIMRSASPEVILLPMKLTARTTSCTSSLVAFALKFSLHAVPLLTEFASARPMSVAPAMILLPAALSSQIPVPPGLTVGRVKRSATAAFAVICIFSDPPFQFVSPSGSWTINPFIILTGICSSNGAGTTADVFISTDTVASPLFVTIKSFFPSPLTSAVVSDSG